MSAAFPWSMLVTQTWQVTAVAVAVGILTRCWAKDRPHLAHALWILVLVKCVTPPIVSSPTSLFSLLTPHRPPQHVEAFESNPPREEIGAGAHALEPLVVHARPRHSANLSDESFTTRSKTLPRDLNDALDQQTAAIDWRVAALTVWLAGAGLAFTLSFLRLLCFIRDARRHRLRPIPELSAWVNQLAAQLKLRRPVRLMVLDCSIGPSVIGLLRPTILLPLSLTQGRSRDQLRPLLAHELVHIRRGDLWWALLQSVAKDLFWFHPMVGWAARRVTRESERSCDEETIACLGCRPSTYARSLLDVLEHKHRLRVAPALPGIRPVDITSARLERVMRMGQGSHRRTPVWVWLVMLLLGALILPGATMVAAQQPGNRLPTVLQIGPLDPQPEPASMVYPDGEVLPLWLIESYEVGEVLETTLGETGPVGPEVLMALLGCRKPGPNGASSTPNGLAGEMATVDGNVSLGDTEPTMKIVNGNLYALAPMSQHKSIERELIRMKRYGFATIAVDTRFITTPPEMLKKIGIDWSIASASIGNSINPTAQAEHVPSVADESDIAKEGSGKVEATSYVERNQPVLFAVLDEAQRQQSLQKLSGNRRSDVISAPKVTLFNGQSASIKDVTSRPFVVGLDDRIEVAEGVTAKALQPVIRVIEEGTTVNLKAIAMQDGGVRLDYELLLSKIRKVEVAEVPIGGGAAPAQIQVPEVATTSIDSTLNVPAGKTLVLSCLTEVDRGKKQAFLVFVTCHVIKDEALEGQELSVDGAKQAKPTTKVTETESQHQNDVGSNAVGRDDIEFGSNSGHANNERSDTRLHTAPVKQTSASLEIASPLRDRTDVSQQAGVAVKIDGDLHYTVDGNRPEIKGQNLRIQFIETEQELAVTATRGAAVFDSTGLVSFRMSGDVKVVFNGISLGAEQAMFESRQLQLFGRHEDPEHRARANTDKVSLAADRISLSIDEDSLILLDGDAMLKELQDDGSATTLHAERIIWDQRTNNVRIEKVQSGFRRPEKRGP